MTPDKAVGSSAWESAVRDHLLADIHPHHLPHLQAQLSSTNGRSGLSSPASKVQDPLLLLLVRVELQELHHRRHVNVELGQVGGCVLTRSDELG